MSDSKNFLVRILNVNRPPKLNLIKNRIIDEDKIVKVLDIGDGNSLLTNIVSARKTVPGTSGNKKRNEDIDLQKLTYNCYYDLKPDSKVGNENCEKIQNLKFDKSNGDISWKPNFKQAGNYEFKIVANDNDKLKPLSDSKIFNIIVNNVNRPPNLSKINNQSINENLSIEKIDANDKNSGDDKDIDKEALTYKCFYDQVVIKSVGKNNPCKNLRGAIFNPNNGQFNWKTDFFQKGTYEFKIIATDGGEIKNSSGALVKSESSSLFVIEVKNVNRPPKLASIENQNINEDDSISLVNAKDNSDE